MAQGPEDSVGWDDDKPKQNVAKVCTVCQTAIKIYHCHNNGCRWCAACMDNAISRMKP